MAVRTPYEEPRHRPQRQVIWRLQVPGVRQPPQLSSRGQLAPSDRQVTIEGKQPRRAAEGRAGCPPAADHGSGGRSASTYTSTRSTPQPCRTTPPARPAPGSQRADREIHHGIRLSKCTSPIIVPPCRTRQPAEIG